MIFRLESVPQGGKLQVIKAIRHHTGLDLKSAKTFVDHAPQEFTLQEELAAEDLSKELDEMKGVNYSMRPHEPKGVKVRIAALVDENGKAICIGWGNKDGPGEDKDLKDDNVFREADMEGDCHWVFMTARLPLPRPGFEAEVEIEKMEEGATDTEVEAARGIGKARLLLSVVKRQGDLKGNTQLCDELLADPWPGSPKDWDEEISGKTEAV